MDYMYVGFRSIVMNMSVCPSVRLHKSKTARVAVLHQVFVHLCCLCMAVAPSSSDGDAIRYVLPVLWTNGQKYNNLLQTHGPRNDFVVGGPRANYKI